MDEHGDSMRDVDHVEDEHEDEGGQLEIMDLTCQSSRPINVVGLEDVEDDRDEDDVDELGSIALVHDRHDVYGLGVVLFNQHHVQQDVPNHPIEQVYQHYTQNLQPLCIWVGFLQHCH